MSNQNKTTFYNFKTYEELFGSPQPNEYTQNPQIQNLKTNQNSNKRSLYKNSLLGNTNPSQNPSSIIKPVYKKQKNSPVIDLSTNNLINKTDFTTKQKTEGSTQLLTNKSKNNYYYSNRERPFSYSRRNFSNSGKKINKSYTKTSRGKNFPSNYNNNLFSVTSSGNNTNTNSYFNNIDMSSKSYCRSTSNIINFDENVQNDFARNVKKIEDLAKVVKYEGIERHRKKIEEREIIRDKLQNRVDILDTCIKLTRINRRNYMGLNKGVENENTRMANCTRRVKDESFFFTQQMPYIRKEIVDMKNNLFYITEEKANLNNEKMLLEKKIHEMNDEIARYNKLNCDLIRQKDRIKYTLNLVKNHTKLLREKMDNAVCSTKELIRSLNILAGKAKRDNEMRADRKDFLRPEV